MQQQNNRPLKKRNVQAGSVCSLIGGSIKQPRTQFERNEESPSLDEDYVLEEELISDDEGKANWQMEQLPLPAKLSPLISVRRIGGRAVLPYTTKVVLPYVEMLSITTGASAGVIAGKVFNLLSAYDPNYTDAGHQPLGFDEWSNFYQEYYVSSVKYSIEASNTATNLTGILNVMEFPSVTLTGSTATTYMEQPGSQQKILRHSDAGPQARVEGQFHTASWFPGADLASLDDIRSVVTSSPAESVGLHVGLAPFTSSAVSAYLLIKLEMTVHFIKPKQLTQS
jgi:hypothetical protein